MLLISFIVICCFISPESSAQIKNNVDTLLPMNNDFSNKTVRSVMYHDYLNQLNNTIVIIDKKIYKLDAKEFKELRKENILEIQVIKDEMSKSEIKNIIIIITK